MRPLRASPKPSSSSDSVSESSMAADKLDTTLPVRPLKSGLPPPPAPPPKPMPDDMRACAVAASPLVTGARGPPADPVSAPAMAPAGAAPFTTLPEEERSRAYSRIHVSTRIFTTRACSCMTWCEADPTAASCTRPLQQVYPFTSTSWTLAVTTDTMVVEPPPWRRREEPLRMALPARLGRPGPAMLGRRVGPCAMSVAEDRRRGGGASGRSFRAVMLTPRRAAATRSNALRAPAKGQMPSDAPVMRSRGMRRRPHRVPRSHCSCR